MLEAGRCVRGLDGQHTGRWGRYMGGMQVGGASAHQAPAVGGASGGGPRQAAGSPAQLSERANATQAAQGAEESGRGRGRGRGRGKGRGGQGSVPPGLAGRSWEQLPPGIRKKIPRPTQQAGGCGMHDARPQQRPDQGQVAGQSAPAKAPDDSRKTEDEAAHQRAADERDKAMERHLTALASGTATEAQEPAGFRDWARMQLLRSTGRDETTQPVTTIHAAQPTTTGDAAAAQPASTGGADTAPPTPPGASTADAAGATPLPAQG
jgi:hypothetical protein